MHIRHAAPSAAALSLVGALLVTLPANASSLLSGSVSVTNNSPTLSDVTIGPVSGPTSDGIDLDGFGFSFTADTITYTDGYDGSYTSVGPSGFNGFVLTFTGVPTITGVSLDPSSQTVNPPTSLSFTGDEVFIEFDGGNQVAGQTSIIDVTTSSVPEPGAWAMMLLGFGGVGARLRGRPRRLIARA